MPNGATKNTVTDSEHYDDGTLQSESALTTTSTSNNNHTNSFQEFSRDQSYDDGTQASTSELDNVIHSQYGTNPNGNTHGSTNGRGTVSDTYLVDGTLVTNYETAVSGSTNYNDNHFASTGRYDTTEIVSGYDQTSTYTNNSNAQNFNEVRHGRINGENTVTHINTHSDDFLI